MTSDAGVHEAPVAAKTKVCPWWMIHAFDNPIRRIFQNPEVILEGLVKRGDHCLDLGCGYGYFTVPMAVLASKEGAVTAADLQEEMLTGVKRRAENAGMADRIRFHKVDAVELSLQKEYDFALAFWMIHEVPDQELTLKQIAEALKPEGRFLLVEPKGHVTESAFARTVGLARRAGMRPVAEPHIRFSRAVLLTSDAGA